MVRMRMACTVALCMARICYVTLRDSRSVSSVALLCMYISVGVGAPRVDKGQDPA
jgi:hypothetical protein